MNKFHRRYGYGLNKYANRNNEITAGNTAHSCHRHEITLGLEFALFWAPFTLPMLFHPMLNSCQKEIKLGLVVYSEKLLGEVFVKATPTIFEEAFIFYVWTFFLPRTDIAARRRSGAPSKVCQWLGPRCRQKVTRKNFANRAHNFYRGVKKCEIWPGFSKSVAFDGL